MSRRSQPRSAVTRGAIIDAALHEFSTHGFDAASTRAIAARAGVHQPQINYHFSSKLDLWRAAVDLLFARLDTLATPTSAPDADDADDADDAEQLGAAIRAFVQAAARLPELNRIMVQEATSDSERLGWIVDRHVRRRFRAMTVTWERLRAAGRVADVDASIAYYSLVGAASLLYVNAPEARRLTGADPTTGDNVARHADFLVSMFLTPAANPAADPAEPGQQP